MSYNNRFHGREAFIALVGAFIACGCPQADEQVVIGGRATSVTIKSLVDPFNETAKSAQRAQVLEGAGLPDHETGFAIRRLTPKNTLKAQAASQTTNIIDNSTAPRVLSHPLNQEPKRLMFSFDGLSAWDQRYANDGNQYNIEPPDQGLCVGNGYVLESVNTVLRVFDKEGSQLTPAIDLNTFFGYPAQVDRTTGLLGPSIFDPSCLFDQDTQKWFQVAAVQDLDPVSGDPLPTMHIDIAVSQTANPTEKWVVYKVPAQNNGADGTPDHKCGNYCFGDYPHIGADKYGFYLTTNEFSLDPESFRAAQIYAFSKRALAENQPVVDQTLFDTVGLVHTGHGIEPGFTVWPAQSPKGGETRHGGVAYFLSSVNPESDESYGHELVVWALSNTSSLNDLNPHLKLSNKVVESEPYGISPLANQKAGSFPLGECLNDRQQLLGSGKDCWTLFLDEPPKNEAVIGPLDTNDTRMQQVSYVGGQLYGALDTIVDVDHEERAGIAYFAIQPRLNSAGAVTAKIRRQGYLSSQGYHIMYPAFGVLRNGRGAIGFTVVGEDLHPSAGYALYDGHKFGDIYLAATGRGVQDGFTEYPDLTGGSFRPRWGDYGAVATDGRSIWIANEYTAQTCTLDQYLQEPLGTCSGTRASASNWATRITEIRP